MKFITRFSALIWGLLLHLLRHLRCLLELIPMNANVFNANKNICNAMQCSFIHAHAVTKQLNAYIHMSPMDCDQRRRDTEKQQQQLLQ